jgi:5-oxoprolinase (ATP-hydrolysing) subunit A
VNLSDSPALDLNADLGEGIGDDPDALDDALLRTVTSANVACGGHAGDDLSMARVCRTAVERGVAIGAQVSYVDREGFGRTRLDVPCGELEGQLLDQVQALRVHARDAGADVEYVKPHGALYNAAVDDPHVARAVVGAIVRDAETTGVVLPVLTLPGSELARRAVQAGVPTAAEAFADRGYTAAGRLVPRGEPGALVTDTATVVARVLRLVMTGVVAAVDGSLLQVRAVSVCLHSDTPGAVGTAAALRQALADHEVRVGPFARSVR